MDKQQWTAITGWGIVIFLSFFLPYLFGTVVALEPDVSNWDKDSRTLWMFAGFGLFGLRVWMYLREE